MEDNPDKLPPWLKDIYDDMDRHPVPLSLLQPNPDVVKPSDEFKPRPDDVVKPSGKELKDWVLGQNEVKPVVNPIPTDNDIQVCVCVRLV